MDVALSPTAVTRGEAGGGLDDVTTPPVTTPPVQVELLVEAPLCAATTRLIKDTRSERFATRLTQCNESKRG